MSDIFSVQDIFLLGIYLHALFLSISLQDIFSEITDNSVKSQMVGP